MNQFLRKIPKVTIVCITYNHAHFIRQALDSFLMQKTNFDFQILIIDDCSTDGNQDIIREYKEKYPDKIITVLREKNLGAGISSLIFFDMIESPYVVFCDGDDYFTDDSKLQRQFDFLESHPDYSLCFHQVKIVYDDSDKSDTIFPSNEKIKKNITIKDLYKENFIHFNSCMYRWLFPKGSDWKKTEIESVIISDWYLHILHAKKGKIGYINRIMSVYRCNSGGIWGTLSENERWNKFKYRYLNFYKLVYSFNTEAKEDFFYNSLLPKWTRFLKSVEDDVIKKEHCIYFTDAMCEQIKTQNKKIEKLKRVIFSLVFLIIFLLSVIISIFS